jgi:phage terminase small subunit
MRRLTPKQRIFCKAYLANGYNATQAALTAEYSKKYADRIGSQQLAKPQVKRFLKCRMAQVEKKLDITFEKKALLLWKAAQRSYGPSDEDVEKLKAGEDIKFFFKFEPASLVSSIAELNRMQGHHSAEKKQ